ncbi:hypothetical protein COLU111180_20600 [Cohnella lubricantis]|uniref:Uncharacterized protein n=1 Tax=Cohnella lubricantis TaxID=2163172 RepID=A0A841TEM9_9BACL|nr:hypothetical protein [Cohnella lubricantis]MBB6678706.1 hypothetical protein [Cohnella lubricantis]MBP2119775.1 hypothetical protein [Cohnella lubricantis]
MKRIPAGVRPFALLLLLLALLPLSRAGMLAPVYADPTDGVDEETRRLLEKSLSVVEIDREIERISGLREATQTEIGKAEQRLAAQEIAIAAQREKAGRVLRSYYMGDKDILWAALLNSRSLSDLLKTWEMMDIIFSSDDQILDQYSAQYKEIKEGYDTLQRNKQDLEQVENNLRAQRDRVLALQQELDRAIAASGDADRLRQLMDEMQAYWQNVGIFEVRQQFNSLATAMNNLPQWIDEHPEMLQTSGLKATITVSDSQLNDYLRSQDERMKQLTITFEPDIMRIEGSNGAIQVGIEGHYTVENEPENAIRFHIDKLVFNGLELPDTTRADLEREFDLGFYPQQLISFVKADSVGLTQGQLIVRLRIGK